MSSKQLNNDCGIGTIEKYFDAFKNEHKVLHLIAPVALSKLDHMPDGMTSIDLFIEKVFFDVVCNIAIEPQYKKSKDYNFEYNIALKKIINIITDALGYSTDVNVVYTYEMRRLFLEAVKSTYPVMLTGVSEIEHKIF